MYTIWTWLSGSELVKYTYIIVCKVDQPSHFKVIPPLPGSLPFFKISHAPTLVTNRSFQVFLIDGNATVKLSSINTIHVNQQHYVGFFIFKFTLKYMLGNVYINKVHTT